MPEEQIKHCYCSIRLHKFDELVCCRCGKRIRAKAGTWKFAVNANAVASLGCINEAEYNMLKAMDKIHCYAPDVKTFFRL